MKQNNASKSSVITKSWDITKEISTSWSDMGFLHPFSIRWIAVSGEKVKKMDNGLVSIKLNPEF